MTPAERVLWGRLRKRQNAGCLFRRQYPLGRYIVDFVCLEKRLVVEVDGGQHTEQAEADRERTRWLEAQGYRVVRFWNTDVLDAVEAVVETIGAVLEA
jgi:very-short-patch-repair endonuclease